jgi:hypothetical protein
MSQNPNHTLPDDLENPPDAERLIHGLRDTGYDLYTAAADIIDNSIAAGATEVNIEVLLHEDGRKVVYFGDDGCGMNAAQLRDAMRYGAPKRASAKSLGKFGLGLKTASSACCKKFTVISRSADSPELAKLAWDLDLIKESWKMLREQITGEEKEKFEDLCGETGTLVVWAKCDRILNKDYENPGGIQEQRALKSRKEKLREHIAKVFHKYLDRSETDYPNITIRMDGEDISHWNPFYPKRSEQVLAPHETVLKIESEDGTLTTATLRAWILPHSKDMTDEENKAHARISNRSQGFYIYREGRLIYSEGWLGIFRSDDPHYSLIRTEFCFDYDLDHAFQVDVKKSRIIFDPALEEELKLRLTPARNEADSRYRRKENAIVTGSKLDHTSSNKSIDKAKARTKKPAITSADASKGEATLSNNRGTVKIKTPVQNHVSPNNLYIEEVDDIHDGNLWEPSLRSTSENNHITGVRLNKHHPFYPKVYLKAAASGYTVEGIDFLLWALANAEYNNSNEELKPIFADLREEISLNLKRLLESTPMPDAQELAEAEDQASGDDCGDSD